MFTNFSTKRHTGFGLLIVAALFCFIFVVESQSQCTPDCEGDPWGPPETRLLLLDPCPYTGCAVEVTYVKRVACGYFKDVQITEIEIVAGCLCDPQVIFEDTFEALLLSSPPIFTLPAPGTCDDTWRISAAACFSEFIVNGPEGQTFTFLVPCLGEACCYAGITICVSNQGGIIEIYRGAPHDEVNCDDATPAQGLSSCFTTCDFPGFTKGSTPEADKPNDGAAPVNHSLVMPNPASGSTVEFELIVAAAGLARLTVYNLQGRIVAGTEVELLDGATHVALDVANLQSGTYMYELSAAGHKLISDKLIINR